MSGLRVAEVYGPVWQGEGPATGERAYFLRLGLCNLGCTWCDSAYTWDRERYDVEAQCPVRSPEWIAERLDPDAAGLLVLTGGEPLLWQSTADLRTVLDAWPGQVAVETNGTLAPRPWLAQRLTGAAVSVKVAPQGDSERRRIRPAAIAAWAGLPYAVLKTVCATVADVRAAAKFAHEHRFAGRWWVMPEGTDPFTVLERARELAPVALAEGAHLTLRQHVLLYGGQRER